MTISIQERELMHNGIVRPLSQILATKKEYTWPDKPTAAEFGKGQAWFSDIGQMGYSDGVTWTLNTTKSNTLPRRLQAADYVPAILFAASKDGLYTFGKSGDGLNIVRYDTTYAETVLQATAALLDETGGVSVLGTGAFLAGIHTTTNGMVFAVVRRSSDSKDFLYKSVDNGVNWGNNHPTYDNLTPVHRIGLNGTHLANVTILGERGFTEIKEGGHVYYAYGEYNTVGAGPNDIAVVVSGDFGNTWSRTMIFNSGRHIHYVKQDPHRGYIWVGIGDSVPQSAIIRIDSIRRSVSLGTTYEQLTRMEGFKLLYGKKRYCTTDLHFEPNHILNPVDLGGALDAATSETDAGIWLFDYEMTKYTRVENTYSAEWAGHSQYWIVKHEPTNTLVTCEILESDAVNVNTTRFYASNDNGYTWKWVATARLRTNRTSEGPGGFFVWKDKIWIGGGTIAGPAFANTYAFVPTNEVFDETKHGIRTEIGADGTEYNYGVESILPAAYVCDATGTNSAGYGYSPRTPFKTMSYACGSNRIANGTIVHILGTLNDTAGGTPQWTSPNCPSEVDPLYPTTIVGCGKYGPAWNISTGSNVFQMYTAPRTGRVDFRNINFVNGGAGPLVDSSIDADTSSVRILDSKLSAVGGSCVTAVKGLIDVVRSELSGTSASVLKILSGTHGISASDSLFTVTGTVACTQNNTGGKLSLNRCTVTGFTGYAVNLSAIDDVAKTSFKDCIFYGASATSAILGKAANTYTVDNINNCISNKNFTDVNGATVVKTVNAALTVTGYRPSVAYTAVGGTRKDIQNKDSTYAGCYGE